MINKKWFLPLLPVVVAACAQQTLQQEFGESVKSNQQAQIINPEPVNPENPAGFDGQKAEAAMHNYRNEKGSSTAEKLVTDIVGD